MSVDQAIKLANHYGVSLLTVVNNVEAEQLSVLKAENRQLREKLTTIQSLLQSTCHNITNLIQEDTI